MWLVIDGWFSLFSHGDALDERRYDAAFSRYGLSWQDTLSELSFFFSRLIIGVSEPFITGAYDIFGYIYVRRRALLPLLLAAYMYILFMMRRCCFRHFHYGDAGLSHIMTYSQGPFVSLRVMLHSHKAASWRFSPYSHVSSGDRPLAWECLQAGHACVTIPCPRICPSFKNDFRSHILTLLTNFMMSHFRFVISIHCTTIVVDDTITIYGYFYHIGMLHISTLPHLRRRLRGREFAGKRYHRLFIS